MAVTAIREAASDLWESDPETRKLIDETLLARRRRRQLQIVLGVAVPAVLLLIWEFLAWSGTIDRRFFPGPSTVILSGAHILSEPGALLDLGWDVVATLQRLLIGYVLGASAGVTFGIVMGLYAPVRFGFSPIIYATFPIPKLAYFPLLLIIFGIGDASKVALVTLGVFFMTCINTLSGVLYANPIYRDMAQAFRIPAITQWRRIIVPSALPSIIAGLKLALGNALILVVASEFVAANDGIGRFIWNSWQVLDVAAMFVGLVVIAVVGVGAMFFGNFLERRFTPWVSQ